MKILTLKSISSTFIMCLIFIFFCKQEIKYFNTDLNNFYSSENVSTIIRDVDFFIPAIYLTITGNINLLFIYSTASFITFSTAELLKNIIKEDRPDHSNYKSFPSGHTIVAVFTSHFILTKISKFSGIFFYLIAIVISISRVYFHKHSPHDIAISFIIAVFFVYYADKIASFCEFILKKICLD